MSQNVPYQKQSEPWMPRDANGAAVQVLMPDPATAGETLTDVGAVSPGPAITGLFDAKVIRIAVLGTAVTDGAFVKFTADPSDDFTTAQGMYIAVGRAYQFAFVGQNYVMARSDDAGVDVNVVKMV